MGIDCIHVFLLFIMNPYFVCFLILPELILERMTENVNVTLNFM